MLELLRANPLSRPRVAVERAGLLVIMLAILTAVALATLVIRAPTVGWLNSEPLRHGHVWQAGVAPGPL